MKRVRIACPRTQAASTVVQSRFLGHFASVTPLAATDTAATAWLLRHPAEAPPPDFRGMDASWRDAPPMGELAFELHIHERAESRHDAEVWIIQAADAGESTCSQFGGCSLIIHAGPGAGGVNLEAARELGILVASVPDAASAMVAGRLIETLEGQAGDVSAACPSPIRVGLVGLGSLGQAVAHGLSGDRWELWGHDPFKPDFCFETCGVRRAPLHEIAGLCSFVSVQTPLCAGTRGLLGRDYFQFQKRGQIILNVSPPEVVDASLNPGARLMQLYPVMDAVLQTEPARAVALERALEVAALFVAGEIPEHLLMDPPRPRSLGPRPTASRPDTPVQGG